MATKDIFNKPMVVEFETREDLQSFLDGVDPSKRKNSPEREEFLKGVKKRFEEARRKFNIIR